MIIDLIPMPAPRPRFSKFGTYNPAKYTQYKKDMLAEAKKQCQSYFKGGVRLEVVFFMPIPASLSKKKHIELMGQYHIMKPATDKLIKTFKYSIVVTFYKNDSQICEIKAMKIYSNKPRVQINLYEVD